MQDKRTDDGLAAETRSPAELDDNMHQEAVLGHLLYLYPAKLTKEEVIRELSVASEDFGTLDAYERAIRDLIATGLVHQHGKFLTPSRAAVRGEEIRV